MAKFFKILKKGLCVVLLLSLFADTGLIFSEQHVYAQGIGGNASGQISTGFGAGGIIGSIINCSGVMDKLAKSLKSLFKVKVTEVPVGDDTNNTKENCFDAIAHEIVVRIMDKITLATVDWINGGFEGQPLFLEDPQKFFENVAAREINSLTGWFTASPEGYPFGQIVMTTILTNLQRQFAQNMQFSLNEVLAHGTYEEFQFNFNVGGWAGYSAFFEPNNNPFGNYLLVNRELGRKIGGTTINVGDNYKKQLSESGGFLNQRKCVKSGTGENNYVPADSDPDANPPHLSPDIYQVIPPGGTMTGEIYDSLPADVQTGLDQLNGSDEQAEVYNNFVLRSICKEWKTITPGKVVSDQLTSALNIPTNQLIQADEVSENLALIFDALLLQLVNTGLRSLDGDDPSTNVALAQVQGLQPGQVTNGQAPPPSVDAITGTGFSQETLVLTQQSYIQQAQTALPVLDRLVKKIRALDYCVPGPHPSWFDEAEETFSTALESVSFFESSNPLPQAAEEENQEYYATVIEELTGITIEEGPNMHNYDQFVAFMNNVFDKYSEKMLDANDLGYQLILTPPTARIFLDGLMEEMQIYQASYDDLNEYLTNITSYLPTLISIEDAINQLAQANGGVLNESDPAVQAQLSLFEAIAPHFATEDQLASLIANNALFQNEEGLTNAHLDICLTETVINNYPHPNRRVDYPAPIFPYTHSVSATPLPGPNTGFFDPSIEFAGNTNGGDIDVSFGGVSILGTSSLDVFEDLLQVVY